ncbi:hypothetical protein B0H16DRAFT_1734209 [Mycena metata]|uniref:Uncharacterized protein n=1 Tax=Mycena metata TaxID=1033252 RepID=A0AAD7HW13_9AGAR|nr:hypothetical protein B0H16DRAFT_1734209 [Mycena metata]
MPAVVQDDDPPPSKHLPKRGTLSVSRPEALTFHCARWAVINMLLFILPALAVLTGLTTFHVLGSLNHPSPEDLAYFLAYCSVGSGSLPYLLRLSSSPGFFVIIS